MDIKKYKNYEVKDISTEGPEYQDYIEYQNSRSGRADNQNHFIHDLKAYSEVSGFKISPEDNIIDVGCRGNATLLLNLMAIGYDNVYGIDIGYEAESQWKLLPDIVQEKLQRCDVHYGIPFDIKFKAITCSHVLEHCFNPKLVIEQFKNSLEDNGIIHLQVPLSTYKDYMNHKPHYAFWPDSNMFHEWLNELGLEIVFSEKGTLAGGNANRPVSDEIAVILKKIL